MMPADRRLAKGIEGAATQYLYDGVDVLQEVRAGAVVPYLSTLGVDEPLARGDAEFYLADALGSAVALTDATGALQTEYSYGPFGLTAATGSPSANPFQYTGRENDGTGLYYYRARYYHPGLGRFVSEDPIPLANGQPNAYAYALNNPVTYADPLGGCVPLAPDTVVDAGFILYDLYRLIADGRKGLGENLTALGADIGGACAPGLTGLGLSVRGTRAALNAKQLKNLRRFEGKLPKAARPVNIYELPAGGRALQAEVPGAVPGSRAVYEKQIDAAGQTLQYTKTTYDPAGNIVHVKDKIGGTTFTPGAP